jgi:hypothetical protein
VADAVSIDSFEVEIMRFQPSAHANEQPLVGADIDDNIDVLRCPYRFHAMLVSQQPHHLAAYDAPSIWK